MQAVLRDAGTCDPSAFLVTATFGPPELRVDLKHRQSPGLGGLSRRAKAGALYPPGIPDTCSGPRWGAEGTRRGQLLVQRLRLIGRGSAQ